MTSATTTAVRQQIAAMGCELFEVGVFQPETARTDASMLLRVWDWDTLLRAVYVHFGHRTILFAPAP
jgi:hypothetical protein